MISVKNLMRWAFKGVVAMFLIVVLNILLFVPLGITGILVGDLGSGSLLAIAGLVISVIVVGFSVEMTNRVIK